MLEQRISIHHTVNRVGAGHQGTIAGDRARHTVHPLGQDRKLRPKPYQGQREGQNRRVTNVPTPADRQRGGSQSTPPPDLLSS